MSILQHTQRLMHYANVTVFLMLNSLVIAYNHLGNNDGKNLNAEAQFRSKEISKSSVVDDMVNVRFSAVPSHFQLYLTMI